MDQKRKQRLLASALFLALLLSFSGIYTTATMPTPEASNQELKHLGIYFGWDQHKSYMFDPDTFMRVAFGDNPWVMSDAIILFSTLWHFDTIGQGGVHAVEAILTKTDQTNKNIWLQVCFDFNNETQIARYMELVDPLTDHPSLYAIGFTNEFAVYPDTEQETIEKLSMFISLVHSKGKYAFAHLINGLSEQEGPIEKGNSWFCDHFDLVLFHNNYPRFDSPDRSNLPVLRHMLEQDYGPGCVGGSQGYFMPGLYWTKEDMKNVIEDFELARKDHAKYLFLAMHYPDDQWAERTILWETMNTSEEWLIGSQKTTTSPKITSETFSEATPTTTMPALFGLFVILLLFRRRPK